MATVLTFGCLLILVMLAALANAVFFSKPCSVIEECWAPMGIPVISVGKVHNRFKHIDPGPDGPGSLY